MALTTTPSRAAASWDTELAAAIPYVQDNLLYFGQRATPTLKLLWANRKSSALGPDAKFAKNFAHDMYDVHAATGTNIRYDLEDIDPVSRMEWSPKTFYVAAATNKFEVQRYKNANRSLFDLAKVKVNLMQMGLTEAFNWLIWSNWNETIAGSQINLNTVLSSLRVKPNIYFKSISKHSDRVYSIPMLGRKYVTGHTVGNVSAANDLWQSYVSDATGATVTRDTTAWSESSHEQTDVVTALSGLQDLSYSDIETHLQTLCVGSGHEYVCACPASLYGVIYSYLKGFTQRSPRDEYLLDLGINGPLTDPQFDVTYYVDPTCTALWPSSLWFFDINHVYIETETGFDPDVEPLTDIPGTNQMGTMATYSCQVVTDDRANGISAMHGWQAGG